MSRLENQNKKRKKRRYVYLKLGITPKFIEDTKEGSQIRVMEVKKITYGETCLYRFALAFLPFIVDLTY